MTTLGYVSFCVWTWLWLCARSSSADTNVWESRGSFARYWDPYLETNSWTSGGNMEAVSEYCVPLKGQGGAAKCRGRCEELELWDGSPCGTGYGMYTIWTVVDWYPGSGGPGYAGGGPGYPGGASRVSGGTTAGTFPESWDSVSWSAISPKIRPFLLFWCPLVFEWLYFHPNIHNYVHAISTDTNLQNTDPELFINSLFIYC